MLRGLVKLLIGKAPEGVTLSRTIGHLLFDPHQTRTSKYPIELTHPVTGLAKLLSEFAEEVAGKSRFAIEAEDGILFIRAAKNKKFGIMFIPTFFLRRGTEQLVSIQDFGKEKGK